MSKSISCIFSQLYIVHLRLINTIIIIIIININNNNNNNNKLSSLFI